MFRINNSDFQILAKFKQFLDMLERTLENVPRKDIFYKDLIREKSYIILDAILECSYDDNYDNIINYKRIIRANIAMVDFLIDRLFNLHYISDKQATKISMSLVEINKMVSGWINNMVKSAS